MPDPYYTADGVTLHLGDSLNVLPTLADASVDAIVCDPPYELGFMGKAWDSSGIAYNVDLWRQCWRILKPGGHLLAFGGTRTYHRMTCAIEDAGFEIRDSLSCAMGSLAWYYGSGFPKSKAVSRDSAVCQCVPDLRDPATEDATQSAAEVLLAEVRRSGEADASHVSDLHGLPVSLHPDFAVPSRTKEDVLPGVRSEGSERGSAGRGAAASEDGQGLLLGVQHGVRTPSGVVEPREGSDMLPAVCREGALGGPGAESTNEADQRAWRGGAEGEASRRVGPGEKPRLEGRGDVQAAEGQLHRPEVRPLPAGLDGDGQVGRLHHGAPSGDGPLDWPTDAPHGSREPQGSQPEEQRQGEPGAVSVERGPQARRGWPVCGRCGKPALPAGLGTALKPAWEPIVLARRPLDGTTVANVLEHGTGALNIDGCRTVAGQDYRAKCASVVGLGSNRNGDAYGEWTGTREDSAHAAGRWPTNILLGHGPDCVDGGDCQTGCPVTEMDRQSGVTPSNARANKGGSMGYHGGTPQSKGWAGEDSGGASRFFPVFRYEAKAPASERPRLADGTAHTTVKPLALMQWLVRLVTPPGGTVLDPFAGSGTTLAAALREDMQAIGVEQHEPYAQLCVQRLSEPYAVALFGDIA